MIFEKFIENYENSSQQIYSEDLKYFVENHQGFNTNITQYLNSFCVTYSIKLDNSIDNVEIVAKTFWQSALILYKHFHNDTGWSESSIEKYEDVVRKILEMLIYIIHVNVEEINDLFLDDSVNLYDHYYFYLVDLNREMTNNNFKIIKGKYHNNKSERNFILLFDPNKDKINSKKVEEKYVYHPVGNHQLARTAGEHDFLTTYFKTFKEDANVVWRIFSLTSSAGYSFDVTNGTFKGNNVQLEIYEIIDYIEKKRYVENVEAIETIKELDLLKSNEILSPMVNEKNAKLVNSTFYTAAQKNSIESYYKKFLIQKAISNSYILQNLHINTDYSKVSLPVLKNFLKFLIKNEDTNSIFYTLIVFSIILGFSVEKIIYALLGLDSTITYKKVIHKSSKLLIKINKENFAEFEKLKENDISYKTKIEGEIYLINSLERLWLAAKNKIESYILEKISYEDLLHMNEQQNNKIDTRDLKQYVNICNEFKNFDDINKNCQKVFSNALMKQLSNLKFVEFYINEYINEQSVNFGLYKKKFTKSINLNFKDIHTLFLFYYKTYNDSTEIPLLFTQSMSKNDATRQTYCNTTQRLIVYEKWIYKLAVYLDLDTYFDNEPSRHRFTEINHENKIGSNNYIKPYQFKNFLLSLSRIDSENEITKLNIAMIYLRYSFSILLVSRDIIETSSDLTQVSKRFKIITIQEKGKSIYQGKRIIPLTERALKYINTFYELKKKYNISSYSPVIMIKNNQGIYQESPITKKTITNYFEKDIEYEKDEIKNAENLLIYNELLKFIKYTKLNFGRHIITSEMVKKGIQSNYIDAVMNHFQLGKEDQGKFSTFNTSKYVDDVKNIIQDIEDIYFPNSLFIEDFLWT